MNDLSTEQEKQLRGLLVRAQDEIERSLEYGAEAAKPVELEEPIGRLSRMDAIQQQQMARASRQALELRRRQIQAALAAMQSGTYGECRRCEEPIGYPRLQARPETPFCIECQSEVESR